MMSVCKNRYARRACRLSTLPSTTYVDMSARAFTVIASGPSVATASEPTPSTHKVINQSHNLQDYNLFESDPALKRAVLAFCGSDHPGLEVLSKFGKESGSSSWLEAADLAEKNKPTLRSFDPYGHRVDIIDYHPAYHQLMRWSLESGSAAYGFNNVDKSRPGSHVVRAGLITMSNQLEPGHCCPVVMTAAAVPVMRNVPGWGAEWLSKLKMQEYDHRNVPISQKKSVTMGMSMTEKQGGSDVRANTTIARPIDLSKKGLGDAFLLRGHKWFTSAAMSDGFLTLAKIKPEDPPSCFLVPRWLPNGQRNGGFNIMRLKDKCADRSNASSEIEYNDAWAMLVSEEGRGVRTIIDMVQCTRMDCALGSAGLGRRALQCAIHHANNRSAFGKKLIDQPLMENLLADLCIESEAATMMAMYMANAFDRYENGIADEKEKELFRIGVTVTKYYVTKRLPQFSYECMEVFGGNGFAEDHPMAKLFRHSPLNSIWEGSGNVIALDILRASKSLPILLNDINATKGQSADLDKFVKKLSAELVALSSSPDPSESQRSARNFADRLAIAFQASILLRYGNKDVAAAFIQSRVKNDHGGQNYGTFVYNSEAAKRIVRNNLPVYC